LIHQVSKPHGLIGNIAHPEIILQLLADSSVRGVYGGVGGTAEGGRDFREAGVGEFSGKVCAEASGQYDLPVPAAGEEFVLINPDFAAYHFNDSIKANGLTTRGNGIVDQGSLYCKGTNLVGGGGCAIQPSQGFKSGEGAKDLTNRGYAATGDRFRCGFGQAKGSVPSNSFNKSYPQFSVWAFYANHHSRKKTTDEWATKAANESRVGIGGYHDRGSTHGDGIHGMEEFALGSVLVGKKLHIINGEQIELSQLSAKGIQGARSDRSNIFIGELLASGVADLSSGATFSSSLAKTSQEVGFSDSAVTMNEEHGRSAFGGIGHTVGGVKC
jgi:hypothetical protein